MFSIVSLIWIICTILVCLGALFAAYPTLVPSVVLHLYLFGKMRDTNTVNFKTKSFLLPKSYFSHFYLGGFFWITTALITSLYVSCGGGHLPEFVLQVLSSLKYPAQESYGDMFSNLIVLACANFQVLRRFTECLFVSIYSPESKMSIAIYLVGVAFYAGLPLTSLAGTDLNATFSCKEIYHYLRWNHLAGVLLFFWASWQQRKVAFQFAKLRVDKSGKVMNTNHHIPHGGLFKFVSCPHYFVEILIYLSMNIVFAFKNTMMVWLFVFVVANQLISGYFSHVWYQMHFPSYPKNRKAVLPFLF